ncbi:glutamate 5-kinase [Geminicoccus roseus]|uniref:glutamate 5-kinase n=1 Tax=Geminicoccus roseus TaxID=404900 RepID=UPI00054F0A46|nr:glutamate 5-kinase [Geminicoccus roseus]
MLARRLVVKVGSSLLVQPDGDIRQPWLDSLTHDIQRLRARGTEVIVVSSGAIALGRRVLGLPAGPLPLEQKQAAAAAGQIRLAGAWAASLGAHGLPAAQILLTLDDTESRRRYLNARSTFAALLNQRAVPVVNENDTVATTEIRFGDNDRLSARVAVMASAETLVLLSDVDGLYTADPRRSPDARHLPVVEEITPEIEAMAGGAGSVVGTGGMVSKLVAARIATHAGCAVLLARGDALHPLDAVEQGARSSLFVAKASPHGARKHWIAAALGVTGVLRVDEGAARALVAGRSLLPAGVRTVEGRFERGDAVLIRSIDGRDLAKGLVAYDADDAARIVGLRSDDIERTLGYRGRDELIHRDDLVLL